MRVGRVVSTGSGRCLGTPSGVVQKPEPQEFVAMQTVATEEGRGDEREGGPWKFPDPKPDCGHPREYQCDPTQQSAKPDDSIPRRSGRPEQTEKSQFRRDDVESARVRREKHGEQDVSDGNGVRNRKGVPRDAEENGGAEFKQVTDQNKSETGENDPGAGEPSGTSRVRFDGGCRHRSGPPDGLFIAALSAAGEHRIESIAGGDLEHRYPPVSGEITAKLLERDVAVVRHL